MSIRREGAVGINCKSVMDIRCERAMGTRWSVQWVLDARVL